MEEKNYKQAMGKQKQHKKLILTKHKTVQNNQFLETAIPSAEQLYNSSRF